MRISSPPWLVAEADVGSQQLLDRLIALDPERYGPQHKRTLQRRLRDWRVAGCSYAWKAQRSCRKPSHRRQQRFYQASIKTDNVLLLQGSRQPIVVGHTPPTAVGSGKKSETSQQKNPIHSWRYN